MAVDLVSRTVELTYNVRWVADGDDVILASGAVAKLTLSDERWEELSSAIRGAVDDLSQSLGLSVDSSDSDPDLGFGDGLAPDLDDQEL